MFKFEVQFFITFLVSYLRFELNTYSHVLCADERKQSFAYATVSVYYYTCKNIPVLEH